MTKTEPAGGKPAAGLPGTYPCSNQVLPVLIVPVSIEAVVATRTRELAQTDAMLHGLFEYSPDAIVLVVLGVLASLIPQVPNVELSPSLVLLVFLPPLVYNAAFFSAPRETRENAVPITALAIGATTVTIIGVGWVTRLVLPATPTHTPKGPLIAHDRAADWRSICRCPDRVNVRLLNGCPDLPDVGWSQTGLSSQTSPRLPAWGL